MAKQKILCPCCGRNMKPSKLKIHSTLAAMLIVLYNKGRFCDNGWVHLSDFKHQKLSGNDFSIVKHWGLAESKPIDTTEKNSSGYWRITNDGCDFVLGVKSIPLNKFVFNNKVQSESKELVSIKEALRDKFDISTVFEGELSWKS